MTKLEQAARHALMYLEAWQNGEEIKLYEIEDTITALREALAEPNIEEMTLTQIAARHEQATISGGLCGGCAKKAADGWALYCVECWEKAEQEPVGFFKQNDEGFWFEASKYYNPEAIQLYAAPVRTKELTDDEIYKLADDVDWAAGAYLGFARAVIAADREKNNAK